MSQVEQTTVANMWVRFNKNHDPAEPSPGDRAENWGYRSASRRDIYLSLGWVECGTCEGSGNATITKVGNSTRPDRPHVETWSSPCPDCAFGLVPSEGIVESALVPIALIEGVEVDKIPKMTLSKKRTQAALVAAARAEYPDGQ